MDKSGGSKARILSSDLNLSPPPINARFFYRSLFTIDDPLATVPPASAGSNNNNTRLHPFSIEDNKELDAKWNKLRQQIRKESEVEREAQTVKWPKPQRGPQSISSRRSSIAESHKQTNLATESGGIGASLGSSPQPYITSEVQRHEKQGFPRAGVGTASGPQSRRASGSARNSPVLQPVLSGVDGLDQDASHVGLTGTPFLRAPSRSKLSRAWASPSRSPETDSSMSENVPTTKIHELDLKEATETVLVGASRIHQVTMPNLKMEPIYWTPIHDTAGVIRATWFYYDSMLPVEVDVANMLERGYITMRPWTQTWKDELSSAVHVGAEGEVKIAHQLWPETSRKPPEDRQPTATDSKTHLPEDETAENHRDKVVKEARRIIDESTDNLGLDNKASGTANLDGERRQRHYSNSQVIYANEKDAFILKPALQPSSYHGRRPYANYIRRGHDLGIRVVRGFSQSLWDRYNPHDLAKKASSKEENRTDSQSPSVPPRRPRVTDLVLVIHGIGQKLSERVESFNFTHAINGFRREVHAELEAESVRSHLRDDIGSIMVLPVNWRSTLSFEEGGYRDGLEDLALNSFSLQDITPESLPNIRNIVSDVMLDIPYYLSHHQPKMISAVISEANRIYKLWCQNNPGFERSGNVHIIAHSLGSVMALDILSNQPTSVHNVPIEQKEKSHSKHFMFDTKNLYLCGSPAGFFLLLRKSTLMPRRHRNKPTTEEEDLSDIIAGDQGSYGCIAIDNVYNIINPYDPVAYKINATVDSVYAASLKPAIIPSASGSWFSFANPFKRSRAGRKGEPDDKRPKLTNRLPSNVELEIHNFTREEIAEKRAYLLNDNGQIDFLLKYGGGPLEIQYLTMLGAHSSYWTLRDFVRFVVIETGRPPGRDGTVEALRAAKKKNAYTLPKQ